MCFVEAWKVEIQHFLVSETGHVQDDLFSFKPRDMICYLGISRGDGGNRSSSDKARSLLRLLVPSNGHVVLRIVINYSFQQLMRCLMVGTCLVFFAFQQSHASCFPLIPVLMLS